MMDTILNHKSIRRFSNIPVSEQILNQILEAASRASTTGNMQTYSIIVSQNEEKKRELWEAHFKQNMVLQAPVILTFCADFNRVDKWCDNRKAEPGYDNFLSFYTATIDALLASQNAALAAEYLGLGICYLGTTTYMARKICEILNLPQHVVPVTTIVLGFPDETPELTDRLPLEAIVHFEEYLDYSKRDIDRIYAEKEELESNKKFITENKKETLAQVFTDVRYKKTDNVYFSLEYLKVIQEQGFMNQ
jgi:nitroreductase